MVISDISMPRYTGIDIIREVHEKNLNIKFVFISASATSPMPRMRAIWGDRILGQAC